MWPEHKRLLLLTGLAVLLAAVFFCVHVWPGLGNSPGPAGVLARADRPGNGETDPSGNPEQGSQRQPPADPAGYQQMVRIAQRPRAEDRPQLLEGARNPDPQVREVAIGGLARLPQGEQGPGGDPPPDPPKEDVETLVNALCNDESAAVRIAAATTLGKLKCWDAGPALIDAMEDPDPRVRSRAGTALDAIVGVQLGFQANSPARHAVVEKIRNLWPMFYEGHLKRLEDKRAGR